MLRITSIFIRCCQNRRKDCRIISRSNLYRLWLFTVWRVEWLVWMEYKICKSSDKEHYNYGDLYEINVKIFHLHIKFSFHFVLKIALSLLCLFLFPNKSKYVWIKVIICYDDWNLYFSMMYPIQKHIIFNFLLICRSLCFSVIFRHIISESWTKNGTW